MTTPCTACLLALALPVLFAACSGNGGGAETSGSSTASTDAVAPTSAAAEPTTVAADPLAANLTLAAAAEAAAERAKALAVPDVATPAASATLTALRYTDANNWYMRTLESSVADSVPDAQNQLRFYEVHRQSTSNGYSANGVVHSWGFGNGPTVEGRLYWNGSGWVDCKLGTRGTSSVRDDQGRHVYSFCNGYEEGSGVRRVVDVSGQSIATVVSDYIRTFPGDNGGVTFASWGPSNLALYGSATFPAGSALHYQFNTVTKSAYAYDAQNGTAVTIVAAFNAAVAAGGDARGNPGSACNDPTQSAASSVVTVTTLETLIARNPGTPCVFNPGGTAPDVTGPTNEWWSNSTVSLGTLAGAITPPAGTGNYYSTTAGLRVAFASSGKGVTFYNCLRRTSDGSTRNCSAIGRGTWTIQTLGDARVMSFSVAPPLAQKLGYARVFVERGGKVYYGFKSPVNVLNPDIRLNLQAANAVLRQLGLPVIQPVTQPGTATDARAAALASIKGVWGSSSADGTEATIFRFGDNGRMLMAEAKPFLSGTREQSGAELGWLDYDPDRKLISTLVEWDSNLTSGTSHPSATESEQSRDLVSNGLFAGQLPRLPADSGASSLVGVWAQGSATDLKAIHFAFFANGRFLLIDASGADEVPNCGTECPPGVEFGQYTFNAATGSLRVFSKIYDTNGCAGTFNSCASAVAKGEANTESTSTWTLAADGQTAIVFFSSTDGPYTMYRIT